MEQPIHIFDTLQLAAEALTVQFINDVKIRLHNQNNFSIALSGGNTPRIFYTNLGKHTSKWPAWKHIHLFWGDERCVPPADKKSNYRMARETLIDHIEIAIENIHRIQGESDPASEAVRYQAEIIKHIPLTEDNWPAFDWILLGMGGDGHTASLFPGADTLEEKKRMCTVAVHPQTSQKRISLTLPVINRARKVIFLISGASKAPIIQSIIKEEADSFQYPAAYIRPLRGALSWYLDKEAGHLL